MEPKIRFKNFKAKNEYPHERIEKICSVEYSNKKKSDAIGSQYALYDGTKIIGYTDTYDQEEEVITISKDGTIGNINILPKKTSIIGTSMYIKKNENTNIYFLYKALTNFKFRKFEVGSTIKHIYFKDFKKELLFFPSLKEQEKIGNFFKAMDEEIELLEREVEILEKKKKYYLQNMFC